MPPALLNWMVMSGPWSHTDLRPVHPATISATTGMIQTNGNERLPFSRATACGISSSSAMVDRIPDEARIDAERREHGEDHDRAERDGAIARLDVREGPQVHERHQRRSHVDVGPRP